MKEGEIIVVTLVVVVEEEEVHITSMVKVQANNSKSQELVEAMALGEEKEEGMTNLVFNVTIVINMVITPMNVGALQETKERPILLR